MNYAELTQAIQDYLETAETSFVAQIPTFVRQAEERVFRTVLLPELRKNATATVASGAQYIARPSDFLAVFSLAVIDGSGEYYYLLERDVSFIREAYPSPSTTGLPRYYAQFDGDTASSEGHFIVGPTSDATYTAELHYYYDPPSIVTSGTSWLGDNAETVLLYGALVEGYTFLKGEADLLAQYDKRYQEALAQLGGLARRSADDTYRS